MYRLIKKDLVTDNDLELPTEYATLQEANAELAEWTKRDEKYTYFVKLIKKRGRPAKEPTKVMRIPETLVPEVEGLIAQYKKLKE